MRYAVHLLEPEQESAVTVCMGLLLATSNLRKIWKQVRLKTFDPNDVEVVVVPLQRIGAPAGKSGAEVFVVYMRSVKQLADSLPPSNALVLKLQKNSAKLDDEMKGASKWPDVAPDRFAKPIKLFTSGMYTVLLAPFRAGVKPVPDEHILKFQSLLDLYRTLTASEGVQRLAQRKRPPTAADGVKGALELVSLAHAYGRKEGEGPHRSTIRYSDDYEWYFRQTHKPDEDAEAKIRRLFGNKGTLKAFGRSWLNPISLFKKILGEHDEFEGARGAVHGDLHPKNIIFDAKRRVQIIDFGWAVNERHVCVDYVLLDINLRAVTLPSHVQEQEMLSAASYLYPNDACPTIDGVLGERLRIVRDEIWAHATSTKAVSKSGGDPWLFEYLIPYFLVSYGLLVFLDNALNQRAMVACVLAASERIANELKRKP